MTQTATAPDGAGLMIRCDGKLAYLWEDGKIIRRSGADQDGWETMDETRAAAWSRYAAREAARDSAPFMSSLIWTTSP